MGKKLSAKPVDTGIGGSSDDVVESALGEVEIQLNGLCGSS